MPIRIYTYHSNQQAGDSHELQRKKDSQHGKDGGCCNETPLPAGHGPFPLKFENFKLCPSTVQARHKIQTQKYRGTRMACVKKSVT